jgi:hypothetical protein
MYVCIVQYMCMGFRNTEMKYKFRRKNNNIVYRIFYENLDSRWHLNTLCSLFLRFYHLVYFADLHASHSVMYVGISYLILSQIGGISSRPVIHTLIIL